MGEEYGRTIEALLCYVINLSVFFIRSIGLKFTMIFSDHSHATSVGEGIGMLAFVLCLVGVVHYLNQANDHYMEEKPSSPVASYPPSASHPPSSSTSSRPPSSSTPSRPPSSSTHSKPPSSSTSSKPSSSPTPSYPPPSSTVASDQPSTSSSVDSDHQSTSSSSSFSYPPPPPPPPNKVKPPTYVGRGDFARMVSDVSLRSEDFRLGVSGDSDIDNKAGRFITETKEKRKLEVRKTVGIEPLNKSCNKENAPSEEKKKKNRVKQRRSEDEDEVVSRRRRSCLTKKKTRRRRTE